MPDTAASSPDTLGSVDAPASIRLTAVSAVNYRCFTSLDWTDIRPGMNAVIAQNGGGKTALLDAIAVGLAPLPRFISDTRGDKIVDGDVARARVGQQTIRSGQDVVIGLAADLAGRASSWRVERGPAQWNRTRAGTAAPLRDFAQQAWRQRGGGPAPLPVIAYYGTSRLWGAHRHTEKRRAMEVADGYLDCLDPRVDFQSFEEWTETIAHDRLNPASGTVARIEWEYLVKVLAIIMRPAGLTRFEYSAAERTLLACSGEGPMLPVRSHSDGIRTILGMVGDIVRRICLLNADIDGFDISLTTGIVLVDEVDLHLHPRWQQVVGGSLREAFPRIQWILTTHSPQVVSTLPRECVWHFERHAEGTLLGHPQVQTEGAVSSDVLADVFGVDPMPDTPWRTKLERLDQLIDADSDELAELLRQLADHFGPEHEYLRNWRIRRGVRQPGG